MKHLNLPMYNNDWSRFRNILLYTIFFLCMKLNKQYVIQYNKVANLKLIEINMYKNSKQCFDFICHKKVLTYLYKIECFYIVECFKIFKLRKKYLGTSSKDWSPTVRLMKFYVMCISRVISSTFNIPRWTFTTCVWNIFTIT